ncbi:MAG: hypothetical protein E7591_02325 [Ruminococcaceae bacterium]|nr:hypothetical protein [Oscillospiraceae bacterium]
MRSSTKLLALFLAVLMLLAIVPVSVFATDSYTVTLHRGSEGKGTTTKKLTKNAGSVLSLEATKSGIKSAYGMQPSAGGSGFGSQRVFIEWNTAQDSKTGKGVGTSYKNYYDADAGTTLYAIWGFEIQYNADGGVFPETGNDIFLTYVVDCDDNNYQNPKTLYGNFDFPEGDNEPVKKGCRRVRMSNGSDFYGLLYADMDFFTTETAKQNLTIPPTGGKLPWSTFNCATTANGNKAPEFYAIWEPSVTYKANGGNGADYSEYLTWTWDRLYSYEDYEILTAEDAHSHFTMPRKIIGSWNTKPDGSGKTYKVGQVINQLSNSDPITLYAQWVDAPTYKVTYNANGGSGKPAVQTKYYDETLTLTSDIPSKVGHTFHGWATSSTAATAKYAVSGTYKSNKNLTLYAVWQPETTHPMTVTPLTDSTCSVQGTQSYECSCGYSYTATLPLLAHEYGAWQNLKDGYLTRFCVDCSNADRLPVTYKINYKDMDGEAFSGELGEGTPVTHTFEAATTLVAPSKFGYDFGGWFTSPDCSGKAVTTLGAKDFTSNITLYAKWTAHSYKINYKDKDNKTFTGTQPEGYSTYHYYGTETVLSEPVKKGYTFLGWYSDKACTSEVKEIIGAEEITAAITLYAKWEVATYTVTYLDVNGGDFSGDLHASTLFTHKYGVATKLYNPTKEGYTFGGWFTSADCATGKVTSLAATTYTDDITLYAKWTANSYKITYKDYNNKSFTGKLSAGYPTLHYYDSETILPIPTKAGYTFLGWYEDKLCTKEITSIDAKNAAAVTVYAKWEVNVYTVTYLDMNGDEFSGVLNEKTSFCHTYGVATTLYNPTKEGYTFGGWFVSEDCTGTKLTSLAKTSYTDDITLYAKWTANKYAITYKDYNNKSFTGKNPKGYPTLHYYDSETILPIPTKAGYTFLGWYEDKLCETEPVTAIDAKSMAAKTFYAKWEVNVYTVTYLDMNGEEFSGELHASSLFTHTYGVATKLYNPTREGYTFGGWFTAEDCSTGKLTSLGKTSFTDDITLYAKWTANKFAITYKDYNAKSLSGKNPAGYPTYHYYDTETLLPIPVKTGYNFIGWYEDKLCEGEIVTAIDAKNMAAKTFYAKWEAQIYSITYVMSDDEAVVASFDESAPDTHTYGVKTTLVNPTREGYTFAGWYTNANFKTKVTALSTTGYTADITLYAKWK